MELKRGYLQVLRLEPRNIGSRYNLALLVHAAGATAEAEHHLRRLKEVAPAGDRRVAELRKQLRSKTPAPRARSLRPSAGGIYRLAKPSSSASPGERHEP